MMLAQRAMITRQMLRTMSTGPGSTITSPARDDDLYRCLKLKCSAHEQAVLDSYETFLKSAASHLNINYVGTEVPFRTIKRKTMLASRFVHKKYRVQYEARSYYRHVIFKNLTGSTTDTFLEYIERNLPEGVLLMVEKHRIAQLPFDLTADQTNSDEQKPK